MTATLSPVRVDRVTASGLPAVLGISPYMTRADYLRIKVREHFGDPQEFTGNFVTEWGRSHEADAIADYEMTHGVRLQLTGSAQRTFVCKRFRGLAATPDGVVADRVVECKVPYKALYTTIAERPDYEAQIRTQMEATGLKHGDLAIYRPGKALQVDSIEYDPDWLPSVRPHIELFLAELEATVADPDLAAPHREPLKDNRTDMDWADAATEWKELDYLVRQLEGRRKQVAARIAGLSPDKPARGFGVDLLRYPRRGAVQYTKLLNHLNVSGETRESFRGKTTVVTSVRRVGGPKERTEQ